MLDKDFITFNDSGVAKDIDYTPNYQITKLASDNYQFYDFTENKAYICNAKALLKRVASVRGGKALNQKLTEHVLSMDDFGTITVAASAMKLNKTASTTNKEPWKVVAVNGVEYFVRDDEEEDQPQEVHKVTAALKDTLHTYTIKVKAHNVREIIKIADLTDTMENTVPGTTQMATPEQIAFDVKTTETPQAVHTDIQKALEQEGVYLPDSNVKVFNDSCPCGCGKNVHHHECEHGGAEEAVVEDIPEGYFVLVPVASQKRSFAKTAETLKTYADAHYSSYNIYNDKHEVVASEHLDPHSTTFAEDLTAFLDAQKSLEATAAGPVDIIKPDGTERNVGEEPQVGDKIVDDQGNVKTVTNVEAAEDTALEAKAAPEQEPAGKTVVDPNEKAPQDTSSTGDDDTKRWKGMREDPATGKYVVYITETEEHIYDNLDDAVSFMTRG